MLMMSEPWIQTIVYVTGLLLVVFIIIPTLVRWVWNLSPSKDDQWWTDEPN